MTKQLKKSLPMEMVAEILAKLPVDDIGKFRCVCRNWDSLIGEQFFMHKQLLLSHSVATEVYNHIIVQLRNGEFYAQNTKDLAPQATVVEPKLKKLKFPTVESEFKYLLAGSCNGLLCLSAINKILFWNPSTHRFKVILKLESQIPEERKVGLRSTSLRKVWLGSSELLGFGFVPQECDYKLLRFENKYQTHIGFPKLEIYSLKSDTWKCLPSISNNFSYLIDSNISFPLRCVNHSMYVIARRGKGHNILNQYILLVFNMYKEKFHEIYLPETSYSGKRLALSAYKDSIAIIVEINQSWDIWVMEETNGRCNWRKLHCLRNMFSRPYDMTNNGNMILSMYGRYITYFDPETGSTISYKLQRVPYRVVIYKESLALLDGEEVN